MDGIRAALVAEVAERDQEICGLDPALRQYLPIGLEARARLDIDFGASDKGNLAISMIQHQMPDPLP